MHNWMIRENTNLTVTSALQVRVGDAIGAGNRNLGTGDLTLTSTGGAVRILANITTGGAITLSGGTGGINFNSGVGAKTLSGAAITLSRQCAEQSRSDHHHDDGCFEGREQHHFNRHEQPHFDERYGG